VSWRRPSAAAALFASISFRIFASLMRVPRLTITGNPILGGDDLNGPDDFHVYGYFYVRLYGNNFGLLGFAVPEIASVGLALMAIFGLFHHDGLTGYALGVWARLSAALLRHPARGAGLCWPLGPGRLTAGGSMDCFQRLRTS
jgi:hypothetical protein